jgi:hypothetical protein
MSTHVLELPNPQNCKHLSRSQPRPGREICNGCEQKYLSGIPVEKWPEELHGSQPEVETPESTETEAANDEDKVSSSIETMSSEELHSEIMETYKNLSDNFNAYIDCVIEARRRLVRGETVGNCNTWKVYADCYLKQPGESLSTCLRRLRRELEGINPDTKHRRRKRVTVKDFEEPQNEINRVKEEFYDLGFAQGVVKGEEKAKEKMEQLLAVMRADQEKGKDNDVEFIDPQLSPTSSQQLADKFAEFAISNISEDGTASLETTKVLREMAQEFVAQRQKEGE